MGDMLIVSLTEDEYVDKGPGRPVNRWADRAEVLRALAPVNGVIPVRSAMEAIMKVRPHIFVKGIDYTGGEKFPQELFDACAYVGAEIRYTTSEKMSVTQTIKKELENDKERPCVLRYS